MMSVLNFYFCFRQCWRTQCHNREYWHATHPHHKTLFCDFWDSLPPPDILIKDRPATGGWGVYWRFVKICCSVNFILDWRTGWIWLECHSIVFFSNNTVVPRAAFLFPPVICSLNQKPQSFALVASLMSGLSGVYLCTCMSIPTKPYTAMLQDSQTWELRWRE